MGKKKAGWREGAEVVLMDAPDEFLRVLRIRIEKELDRRLSAQESKYFKRAAIGGSEGTLWAGR